MHSPSRRAGFLNNAWMTAGISAVVIAALVLLLLWNPGAETFEDGDGAVVFYCAAGMRLPVETILERYEEEYDYGVRREYGGSGELLAKLNVEKGDPLASLYLAADDSYIEEASKLGLIIEAISIARMKPVLAVPKKNEKNVRGLDDLLREDVKVVLANPEIAAIGRTARKLLREIGEWAALEKRSQGLRGTLSMVGTVTEVANNLKIGTADAGIVWDATVVQYPELKVVPVALLEKGTQDVTIAVVQGCPRPQAARHLARYLAARDRGLEVFDEMGWKAVEGETWADVTLYCASDAKTPVETIVQQYQEECGRKVRLQVGGSADLLKRLIEERDSAHADLYLATASSHTEKAHELGLLAETLPVARKGEVPAGGSDQATGDAKISVVRTSWWPTGALHFARYLAARDRGLEVFADRGWEPVRGDVWADRPELVLYSGGVNRVAIETTLEDFQKREGASITVKYHGCGILVSDMKAIADGEIPTAFPDAYFACDASFVPPVEKHFHDPQVISETKIVLLVRKGNPKNINTLRDLARPGLRVCTANEEHSALGKLTQKLLEAEGLYEAVKRNVVYQSPSADPLVLRMRANAAGGGEDVAVVYKANCSAIGEHLEVIPVEHSMAKAVQPFVVAKSSDHQYLVERLLAALQSSSSRQRFESVGFEFRAGSD